MKFSRWMPLVAASLVLAGCDGFGQAMTAHTDVVARAAGKELTVEEAAGLLTANPDIPADPRVVEALADIWVDYTLLATATSQDSTLQNIDVQGLMRPAIEQRTIYKLREQVIQPDTTFTDEELSERWLTEGPGAEIRARHILLRLPVGATAEQRDSVRALADTLRQRAIEGEDFAALAEEFSQDPGSAERGGDLGFFSRGRMVAPFEEAAFALEPGEISEVVETPFGYHIIRVEERRQQELEPVREQFRSQLVQQSIASTESAYLDSLTSAAEVTIDEDAAEVVREIAEQQDLNLEGRESSRQIARYRGGELTSGEMAHFLRSQPTPMVRAIPTATDEQIESVIQQLVRKELLLLEAENRGIQLSAAEQDSVRTGAREGLQRLVTLTGLGQSGPGAPAIDVQIRDFLRGAISGTQQLVPLGELSFVLREEYNAEVNENTFAAVAETMEEIRGASATPSASSGTAPSQDTSDGTTAPATADTSSSPDTASTRQP